MSDGGSLCPQVPVALAGREAPSQLEQQLDQQLHQCHITLSVTKLPTGRAWTSCWRHVL